MLTEVFQTIRDRSVTVSTFETSPVSRQERSASNFLPALSIEANTNVTSLARPSESTITAQRTRVQGVGSAEPTEVRIDRNQDGVPVFVRDPLGEWRSTDGETWTTGEPNYRVRRGRVEIDANGVYSFENRDYGVRTVMSPNGTTRREMTVGQVTFSVTRNAAGETTGYSDERGNWTRQGNRWFNRELNETRDGRPELTSFGRYSFSGDRTQEPRVHQTEQLNRIEILRAQIERQYGIRIAPEGTRRSDYGRINVAGVPTEAELLTLQSSLERTPIENYNNRLAIWFIRPDEMLPGDAQSHFAHAVSENSNGPHRCTGCAGTGILREGGHLVIMPRARQTPEGFEGLEGTLIHELAHIVQSRFFSQSNQPWGTGTQRTPEIERFVNALGWRFYNIRTMEPNESGRRELRDGRSVLSDNRGRFWASGENSNGDTVWHRVIGARLDGSRLVGGRISSQTIPNEEMARRAIIPQGTSYYFEPDEAQANALAMYMINIASPTQSRRSLFDISPTLYEVIRWQDQEYIDRFRGRDNGRSRFIRDMEGRIVPNSDELSERIRVQEMQWLLSWIERQQAQTKSNRVGRVR